MYGRERRVLLRHYLEQGLTKAEIARTLKVSRRTVYHWLATGQLDPRHQPGTETSKCVQFSSATDAQLSTGVDSSFGS